MSDTIIWEKYDDYVLCDVNESLQESVKVFTKEHYLQRNTICEMINYKEEAGFGEDHSFYLDHIFRDQCCLAILNEKSRNIVAAAIMKTMTKQMRSWTAIRLVSTNRKLNSLLAIARQMILEADERLNSPTGSLHIFELCSKNNDTEDSSRDWIPILFHGAYRVAQSLKVPLVTFIGFSQSEQSAAIAAEFTEISRIFYPTYTDVDGHRPIPPSDVGEMYAVLYSKDVKPCVPYYELP